MKKWLIGLLVLMLVVPAVSQSVLMKTADGDTGNVPTNIIIKAGEFRDIGFMTVGVKADSVTGYASAQADTAYLDSVSMTLRSGGAVGGDTTWSYPMTIWSNDSLHFGNWSYTQNINDYQADVLANSDQEHIGYMSGNIWEISLVRADNEPADTSATGERPKAKYTLIFSD